jgi:hypothetical protein
MFVQPQPHNLGSSLGKRGAALLLGHSPGQEQTFARKHNPPNGCPLPVQSGIGAGGIKPPLSIGSPHFVPRPQ